MSKLNFYKDQWFDQLVEDCKSIVVESEFTARWALVEGYHQLGERLRQDTDKWEQNKSGEVLQQVAKEIGISTRTIYYAVQFYDKYPALDEVPEGKAISWKRLITHYLPENILHDHAESKTTICPNCKFEF